MIKTILPSSPQPYVGFRSPWLTFDSSGPPDRSTFEQDWRVGLESILYVIPEAPHHKCLSVTQATLQAYL